MKKEFIFTKGKRGSVLTKKSRVIMICSSCKKEKTSGTFLYDKKRGSKAVCNDCIRGYYR